MTNKKERRLPHLDGEMPRTQLLFLHVESLLDLVHGRLFVLFRVTRRMLPGRTTGRTSGAVLRAALSGLTGSLVLAAGLAKTR
jgi:hypothetical protein